jgi:hypothetical protein
MGHGQPLTGLGRLGVNVVRRFHLRLPTVGPCRGTSGGLRALRPQGRSLRDVAETDLVRLKSCSDPNHRINVDVGIRNQIGLYRLYRLYFLSCLYFLSFLSRLYRLSVLFVLSLLFISYLMVISVDNSPELL